MQRIRRGWRLAMVSLGVLRHNTGLAAFPILGGLSALFAMAAFGIPSALLFADERNVLGVILAALAIYASTYLSVFFAVALAAAAARALEGETVEVGDAIAVARRHAGAIAGWAGILASVNIILRAIAERFGIVGVIVAGLLGAAWSLITFLVVPIIAIEGLGPVAALKRSGAIFRERWGEEIVGTASIGIIAAVFGVIPAAIIVGIGLLVGSVVVIAATIAIGVVIVVIAAVVSQAATGIFGVALYRYAVGQGAAAPFSEADLAGAVGNKHGGTPEVGRI